jgi:DNA-directed RNA polymerase specialized sigma24 family protein
VTATAEAAVVALQALSEADRLRLLRFAEWRVKGMGRAAGGRAADDLLSEACLRVCEGRRRWDPQRVSFVGFMFGVMRSISSHWGEQSFDDEARLACELRSDEVEADPLEDAPSESPDVGRARATGRAKLDEINEFFSDDPEVQLVIEGLAEGMTGPEMQTALGLSQKCYAAAFKRMRRGANRLFGEGRPSRA